jgi:hypothetical protein
MSVYIEYVSRRPGVSIEGFHAIVGPGHRNWAAAYPQDRLVLNIARTWRLGPEPEYLAAWDVPGSSVERLGEWETIVDDDDARHLEDVFSAVARIDVAGIYQPFFSTITGTGPLYYGEFFDWAPRVNSAAVTEFFAERRNRHSDLVLNIAADRVGMLGPDPRGIAFWQVPSYASLENIARELDQASSPISLVRAGLYAEIGSEVL